MKIADASRICVYGASFGAYSAMMTAAKAPERPAVVDPADRPDLTGTAAQNLSYREFAAAVDAIATGLLDMGLRKDEIVVVQLPNVWELVAMFLAVSRAGGVLSPMPKGSSPPLASTALQSKWAPATVNTVRSV